MRGLPESQKWRGRVGRLGPGRRRGERVGYWGDVSDTGARVPILRTVLRGFLRDKGC